MGTQRKRTFAAVSAAVSLLLLLLLHLASPVGTVSHLSSRLRVLRTTSASAAKQMDDKQMNNTLGFEKVYVVNLPERSDKRDAMSLAAALTNITVDYIDGVKGDTIPDKALPHKQEHRPMPANFLGSWRAHMNTIREIVEKGISTALIIEDDSDWDVRIKQQLVNFAVGARWLQGLSTENPTLTHSPYGDDWDVLWVGTCIDAIDATDERTFVINNDATAPDYADLFHPENVVPDWIARHPRQSRLVHVAGEPMCTFAYAVSQRGARKLLYNLAVKELQGNFDNALAWACRDKPLDTQCISVYPSLFHSHKAAGWAGKNSDTKEEGAPEEAEARTDEIQWPVKTNLEKLIRGQTDFVDHHPLSQAVA